MMVIPGTDAAFGNDHRHKINEQDPKIFNCKIQEKVERC